MGWMFVVALVGAVLNAAAVPLPPAAVQLDGVLPLNTLTHFCIITGWDTYNQTLARYSMLLGEPIPTIGTAGGPTSNGTYLGKRLLGTTKIAFLKANNMTSIEFLAGEPGVPSWWLDVYNSRGMEVHHMGYQVEEPVWPVVLRFQAANLGQAIQWGHWGTIDQPGSGCYVYMDSVNTLGVTTEILANGAYCDDLPLPPTAR
eukprot:m.45501 g.45501  ORF g.45501 m.45501 type:complete len:201 (+) comp8642_c0_seq2:88-690(+)